MTKINLLEINVRGVLLSGISDKITVQAISEVLASNGFTVKHGWHSSKLYHNKNASDYDVVEVPNSDEYADWTSRLEEVVEGIAYITGKTDIRVLSEILVASGYEIVLET